jgi:hypothetical protein
MSLKHTVAESVKNRQEIEEIKKELAWIREQKKPGSKSQTPLGHYKR